MNDHPLLVVEDDPGMNFIFEEVLASRYALKMCLSLQELETAVRTSSSWSLLIADIRLPDGMLGPKLRELQSAGLIKMPFLVISALDDEDTLRDLFAAGAVDYIIKPLHPSELLVKVERYKAKGDTSHRTQSEIHVNPIDMRMHLPNGTAIDLTRKEYQIMSLFLSATDMAIGREELITRIWKNLKAGTKTFDTHLFNLKRKIRPHDLDIVLDGADIYRIIKIPPSHQG